MACELLTLKNAGCKRRKKWVWSGDGSQVRVPVTKPDGLSLVPRTCMAGKENQLFF